MNKLPQMVEIGELHKNHLVVIGVIDKGPIVITNDSLPLGVWAHPRTWDRMLELMEDQQDIIDALEAKLEIATGQDEYVTLTANEIETWAAAGEFGTV